jgi:hypothetical protein
MPAISRRDLIQRLRVKVQENVSSLLLLMLLVVVVVVVVVVAVVVAAAAAAAAVHIDVVPATVALI